MHHIATGNRLEGVSWGFGIGLGCTYNSISVKDADDTSGPSKSGKDKEPDEGGKDAPEISFWITKTDSESYESADLVINHLKMRASTVTSLRPESCDFPLLESSDIVL